MVYEKNYRLKQHFLLHHRSFDCSSTIRQRENPEGAKSEGSLAAAASCG
jgi:hypothetical protein